MSKLTRSITHIPLGLGEANAGKLAQLDAVAEAYMVLCQQYITAFCTDVEPDKYASAWLESSLSARWQRVVIQHAAGVAQSWRTNRGRALEGYKSARARAVSRGQRLPELREWSIPILKKVTIQANANVVVLEPATDSTFDYWLKVSTLEPGKPVRLPIRLAPYHRRSIGDRVPNTSVTLTRKSSGWWLTVTVDDQAEVVTSGESPVVGVDIGITNFLTTSTGKRYGTFKGKLAERHQRDRKKRKRKAKLRACLERKGVAHLPSLTNERLGRHVRQEINRAVNLFYDDHPDARIAYEDLDVRTMRFKVRQLNAYLYASNLSHLPRQLAWVGRKRGQLTRAAQAAYSSQECSRCHFVSRANRPDQQTFCCQACAFSAHADENAAMNHQSRFDDHEMQHCRSREEVWALLAARHLAWLQSQDGRSPSSRREPTPGCESVSGQSGVGKNQRRVL